MAQDSKNRRESPNRGHRQGPHRSSRGRTGQRQTSATADGPLLLYGIHTVAAALANPEREKHRLLATPNAQARLVQELQALGEAPDRFDTEDRALCGVPVETVTAAALSRRLGADAVHQGCGLECSPLASESGLDPSGIARALVLDQITDPHNVGAILRSAAAFGVDAVITTARHSPSETGVLAKSASGALDHVPLIRVRNLGEALEAMASAGIALVGLDSAGPAPLDDVPFRTPYALVLGAEGKGLRQKTQGLCTDLTRLDMPGTIKSLNVSNAAAIALYAARSRET